MQKNFSKEKQLHLKFGDVEENVYLCTKKVKKKTLRYK